MTERIIKVLKKLEIENQKEIDYERLSRIAKMANCKIIDVQWYIQFGR